MQCRETITPSETGYVSLGVWQYPPQKSLLCIQRKAAMAEVHEKRSDFDNVRYADNSDTCQCVH